MEWVEVTGRTIEEAKDAALDQLGVDEAEAEFEILEEPRAGLFGRLRSEARVRARVLPSVPRPKVERRERRRSRRPRDPEANQSEAREAPVADAGELEVLDDEPGVDGDTDSDEVEVAEAFLTGLLETFGAPFTIDRRELEEGSVELSVGGEGLGLLIGPRGQTLGAVQELTRTVVQRKSRGRASRVNVDIAGYRQARRRALERFATGVAERVRATGVPRVLEPMPPADRKVVHDAVNPLDGVTTASEGEEPRRRVIIAPAPGGADAAAAGGATAVPPADSAPAAETVPPAIGGPEA